MRLPPEAWGSQEWDNGELLSAAAASGFTALLTMDLKMMYQQSHATLPIAVIVRRSFGNKPEYIASFIGRIVELLKSRVERRFYLLE